MLRALAIGGLRGNRTHSGPESSVLQTDVSTLARYQPIYCGAGPHPLGAGQPLALVGSSLLVPTYQTLTNNFTTGPADTIVSGAIAGVNEEWSRLPLCLVRDYGATRLLIHLLGPDYYNL